MEIISQNYTNILENLIINNFSDFIKRNISIKSNENKVFNYINLLDTLDNSLCLVAINSLISIFNSIDNGFKNSPERRHRYHIKARNTRTIMTIFGEITYHKTIYENKFTHEYFCFIDDYLGLAKYDYFDPYIKACIIDYSSQYPYSQVAKMMNDLINKRIKIDNAHPIISRQTIRNIILSSKLSTPKIEQLETPETLYIMADEKFIATQNNDQKDIMIKSIVTFDGRIEKNGKSILKNKRIFADVDSNCANESLDYLYYVYDVDEIKNIYVLGDGAKWIKNLTNYYKFNKNTNLLFCLDKFHFKQAIHHIAQNNDLLEKYICSYVLNDMKDTFIECCEELSLSNPYRSNTINEKKEYILNNWNNIKNLYKNNLKCPMESQISHNIAALFSSRPKAYSIKTLKILLKIRLLFKNNHNIKKLYLNNINKKDTLEYKREHLNFSIFNKQEEYSVKKSIACKLHI